MEPYHQRRPRTPEVDQEMVDMDMTVPEQERAAVEVTDIRARRIARLEREIDDLREANKVLIGVIEVFAATAMNSVAVNTTEAASTTAANSAENAVDADAANDGKRAVTEHWWL